MRRLGSTLLVGDDHNTLRLNEVGILVWRLSDGSRTLDEVASEIATTYDVEQDVVRTDAEKLLSQLETAGLIHWASTKIPDR